eukprot:1158975-Pelagomonas_calceolata.AAC.7
MEDTVQPINPASQVKQDRIMAGYVHGRTWSSLIEFCKCSETDGRAWHDKGAPLGGSGNTPQAIEVG